MGKYHGEIMNNFDDGQRQGYFIGLFFRFLLQLIVASVFQFMIMYIFGINIFTFWIMCIILSFFINTALPMGENYPFFRNGLILVCLYFVNTYSVKLVGLIYRFFTPDIIWSLIMSTSVIIGILSYVGKYGNGLHSKNLEAISNFILLIIMVLTFVLYWWEGGLVYLIFRIPVMFFEISLANFVLNLRNRSYYHLNQ